jgi:glutathione S-transferase
MSEYTAEIKSLLTQIDAVKADNAKLEAEIGTEGAETNEAVLTYFYGRGRAEQTRWMLAATNTPFRNVCLDTNAQMEGLRSENKLLFNQLPLLEIDGLQLTQSQAIIRHLARTKGLYGSSDREAAMCDMIADAVNDFQMGVMGFAFVPAESKQAHIDERASELIAKFAPRLEKIVAQNAASTGTAHSVGNSLTYADVVLADTCTGYSELMDGEHNNAPKGNWMADYPALQAVKELVCALPGVNKYLASSNHFPFPGGMVGDTYRDNVNLVLGR